MPPEFALKIFCSYNVTRLDWNNKAAGSLPAHRNNEKKRKERVKRKRVKERRKVKPRKREKKGRGEEKLMNKKKS